MCCKSGDDWLFHAMKREFDCLRKVAKSDLVNSIRVPRLVGLVTSAESGKTIGLLEEYIPTGELSNFRQLEDEGMEASTERRKKWGAQIRETVDLLHKIGVIWGDGKPHNVLVHEVTDDAWVIDFGGGYTEGWVTGSCWKLWKVMSGRLAKFTISWEFDNGELLYLALFSLHTPRQGSLDESLFTRYNSKRLISYLERTYPLRCHQEQTSLK
jgi:serine/threonine protein kinase